MNHHSDPRPQYQKLLWVLSVGAVLFLAAAAMLMPPAEPDAQPPVQAADNPAAVVLGEGSELLQTLSYTRCSHTVTRRVTAPVELYGKTLAEVEALYPEWRITEFSAALVKMEQKPDLFCPDHLVVMPNGAGMVCVFENKYGDALMLTRELALEVNALPAAVQEELERGLGFSTAQELEAWLESVES